MNEHPDELPLLAALFLGLAMLLASCADSGTEGDSGIEYVTTKALLPEDMAVCESIHHVSPDFGVDDRMYRHLDISATGVISSGGIDLWSKEAPEETAELDKTLALYAAQMKQEDGVPAGFLVIRAHALASYGVVEFVLGKCLEPSVGIWHFQFSVRGIREDQYGVLGLYSTRPLSGENSDRELLITATEMDGTASYSINGTESGDLPQAIQAIGTILLEGRAWIRPHGDIRWGTVTRIVGDVMDTGETSGRGQRFVEWNVGFLMHH